MPKRVDVQRRQSNISLIASLLSVAFNICVGFFISPAIVHNLGVEANGFAQLANNFVSFASLITIAINAMSARFTTVSYHRGDIENARKYYSSAWLGNIIIIAVLIVPAAYIIFNIENLLNISTTDVTDVKVLFSFTFLSFFISDLYSVFNVSTTIKNKHYLSSIVSMIGTVIRLVILIILFGFFGVKVYYVSLAALIVSCISLIEYYGIKRKLVPELHVSGKDFSVKHIKTLLLSGIWSVVNKCGDLLMTGFDLLLTNVLIGSIQMGVLSVAKTIPTQLISIASTVSWNWNPKMTKEYAEGNIQEMLKTTDSAAKLSSIIVSIPTVAFAVVAVDFFNLWMPSQNARQLAVLAILSVMPYFVLAGSSAVYNIFTVVNKLRFNSITYIIGAILSIGLTVLSVKYTSYGLYAVAGVSSVIVILRNIFLLLPYAAKCVGMKWYAFYKYVLYNLICSGIVAVVSWVVKSFVDMSTWISLIGGCFLIAVITGILFLFFFLPSESKHNIIRRIIKHG